MRLRRRQLSITAAPAIVRCRHAVQIFATQRVKKKIRATGKYTIIAVLYAAAAKEILRLLRSRYPRPQTQVHSFLELSAFGFSTTAIGVGDPRYCHWKWWLERRTTTRITFATK